ncbi:hypothetical protein [Actinocorallia herbida]|nr:hypothetical protein [Actinocorallia herbida]
MIASITSSSTTACWSTASSGGQQRNADVWVVGCADKISYN